MAISYLARRGEDIERLVSELISDTIQGEAEDPAAHMLRLLQDRRLAAAVPRRALRGNPPLPASGGSMQNTRSGSSAASATEKCAVKPSAEQHTGESVQAEVREEAREHGVRELAQAEEEGASLRASLQGHLLSFQAYRYRLS